MDAKTRAVANWFITKGLADKNRITIMKLVKLMYFAQGWHLALHDAPLFPEDIEAWQYGPVVKSVYDAREVYGAAPMTKLFEGPEETLSEHGEDFLTKIWGAYSPHDGMRLADMTHTKDGPWRKAYKGYKTKMSNDEIAAYFKGIHGSR